MNVDEIWELRFCEQALYIAMTRYFTSEEIVNSNYFDSVTQFDKTSLQAIKQGGV